MLASEYPELTYEKCFFYITDMAVVAATSLHFPSMLIVVGVVVRAFFRDGDS